MGLLKDVIYLSQEDYTTLVTTGTVTIGGETLTYNENNLYLTPETQNVKSVNNTTPDASGNVSIPVGTGTVTEVTAGTGLTITGTATETPQVEIASGYKLPTTTEWSNIPQGTVTSVDSINPVSGAITLSAVRYVTQTLTDAQKTQARTNIGAGTSSFTGYTSSNKLDSAYITNNAGWVTGSVNTTNKTVTIGSDTLTFKANAFTDTAIPTTYVKSASASGNTLTLTPASGSALTFTPTFTEQHIGDVISVTAEGGSHLTTNPTTGNVIVGISSGYEIPSTSKCSEWDAKGTYSKPSGGIPASDLAQSYYLASNPNGYTSNDGTVTSVGAGTGLSISGTATDNPTVNVDSNYKLPTNTEWGERLHYCDTLSSVAGSGSSGSYLSVRWYTSGIDGITTPYNGMRIWVKVPLAGVSTAGVVLSINGNNNADYYPVVYNVNTVLTSHFPANSYKCLVFTTGNPNNVNGYLTSNTATKYTSYWHADANYDTNTTMTYGTLAYYFRPYVNEAVYRYKLVMLDEDNRLVPLSKTNLTETAYADYASSTTYAKDVVVHSSGKWYKSLAASNKGHAPASSASWWSEIAPSTPTSTPFRPDKIYWYNTTTNISAGGLMGGNVLMDIGYNQPYLAYCNFNTGMLAYRMIYLCGTYDTTTGLFTLRDGGTAGSKLYYTTAPTNSGSITLSSYFTSGYDYILVGGTYSSNNYVHLRGDHPMYHFDGTNLVPYDTWYTRSYIQSLVYTGDYN